MTSDNLDALLGVFSCFGTLIAFGALLGGGCAMAIMGAM